MEETAIEAAPKNKWVVDSWRDIQVEIVVKSFKVCCISNAMDSCEEVGDDPTDPHEDMLTDRDWQRLENHNVDYEEELQNEV